MSGEALAEPKRRLDALGGRGRDRDRELSRDVREHVLLDGAYWQDLEAKTP
jgi:hypothetical protein